MIAFESILVDGHREMHYRIVLAEAQLSPNDSWNETNENWLFDRTTNQDISFHPNALGCSSNATDRESAHCQFFSIGDLASCFEATRVGEPTRGQATRSSRQRKCSGEEPGPVPVSSITFLSGETCQTACEPSFAPASTACLKGWNAAKPRLAPTSLA
jgi:hypothetical protein